MRGTKISQVWLHVCPSRVLRQISANNDFKTRACGPTVLRPPGVEQSAIVCPDCVRIVHYLQMKNPSPSSLIESTSGIHLSSADGVSLTEVHVPWTVIVC